MSTDSDQLQRAFDQTARPGGSKRHPLSHTHLSKDRIIKTEYGGRTFHSKREAEFARELDLLMSVRDQRDRVESWEPQVRFRIVVNGLKICDYIADFIVRCANGRKELVEVKGYWTDVARLKKKLLEATILADHPELTYRIVK